MFNRNALKIKSLKERKHNIDLSIMSSLSPIPYTSIDKQIQAVAKRVVQAKAKGNSIILLMGGHVIRSGVQHYLIDLMKRGYLSCVAMNGCCVIHEFEFALICVPRESAA